jgi:hypothetical protein
MIASAPVPPPPPAVRVILEQEGYVHFTGGRIKTRRLVLGRNGLYRYGTGMRSALVYYAWRSGDRTHFAMALQADSRGAAFCEATAIRTLPAKRHALERYVAGSGPRLRITSIRSWHRYVTFALRKLAS